MLEYLYLTIRVLLYPKCWFLPWKVNKYWDKRLRYMLGHGPVFDTCGTLESNIYINGRLVVIKDFPKEYGTRVNGASIGHPTRKTMFLLKDMVEDFRKYG